MSSRSHVRVALLWHSARSGNLGVGALTVANVALLERAAQDAGREIEFVVMGARDAEAAYAQLAAVESIPIDGRHMLSPAGFTKAVRGCDVVVDIGAGDSFADIYGGKRLTYQMATKLVALAARKPLVLAPQTLGPFESAAARRLAEAIVGASRVTFARDQRSLESLSSRRARAKTKVTTDVAFALPYTPAKRADDTGSPRVGVNVSALLYHGGYSGANQFGMRLDYPAFVDGLLDQLAQQGATVVLVPHVLTPNMPVEDDYAVCHKLGEARGLEVAPRFTDPSAAKSFISGCDVLIASRMHACIAAISSGVVAIPVAYSRKFAGLFDALGYHHTIEARELDDASALQAVMAKYAARDALKTEVAAVNDRARELQDVYLREMSALLADA